MLRRGKLYYRPRVEEIMSSGYEPLSAARLALGLVKPDSTVLSIGCGSGREVAFLVSIGCKVPFTFPASIPLSHTPKAFFLSGKGGLVKVDLGLLLFIPLSQAPKAFFLSGKTGLVNVDSDLG